MERHGASESRRDVDTAFEKLNVRDNWVHRSVGMKCSTCMWYSPKVGRPVSDEAAAKLIEGRGPVGRCRRHAPTMNGWPVMFASDWCGDHKLDEEKA
jgi:hypothetical protein